MKFLKKLKGKTTQLIVTYKPTFQEFPLDIFHVNPSEMVNSKCVVNALPNFYVIWNIPSNFDWGNKFLNTSSVDTNIVVFGSKAWTINSKIEKYSTSRCWGVYMWC